MESFYIYYLFHSGSLNYIHCVLLALLQYSLAQRNLWSMEYAWQHNFLIRNEFIDPFFGYLSLEMILYGRFFPSISLSLFTLLLSICLSFSISLIGCRSLSPHYSTWFIESIASRCTVAHIIHSNIDTEALLTRINDILCGIWFACVWNSWEFQCPFERCNEFLMSPQIPICIDFN